jgi:hypothetical protein
MGPMVGIGPSNGYFLNLDCLLDLVLRCATFDQSCNSVARKGVFRKNEVRAIFALLIN